MDTRSDSRRGRAGAEVDLLGLDAANAVLLFLLLAKASGRTWPSAFAAALFAVHPLHVESVTWVAESKDVLSTFFGLFALLARLREAPRRSPDDMTTLLLLNDVLSKTGK